MAEKIDGRTIARAIEEQTRAEVEALVAMGKNRPGLTVILVGEDPASDVYVTHKVKACERVGMRSTEHRLPAGTTQEELLALIDRVNKSPHVHGILVQVPLPDHIDERAVIDAIDPAKDVDGFHPINVGRLSTGTGGIWPCTPYGCIKLLQSVQPDLTGMDALVIGRSNIVGKPVAMMLIAPGLHRHRGAQQDAQSAGEGAAGGYHRGSGRHPRTGQGRLGEGRRDRHRRGHQPHSRRERQGSPRR